MAKKSVLARQKKRERTVEKHAEKRKALKAIIGSVKFTDDERWDAQQALQALPRNASPTRLVVRCRITGRAHGVLRRFQLSRIKLRELSMRGDVPGVVKSSW